MKTVNSQRGIGMVAAIALIALIGFGGYAVYQSSTDTRIRTEMSESQRRQNETDARVIATVESDVASTLSQIKENLDLNTEVSLNASVQALEELEARMNEHSQEASIRVQIELEEIHSDVVELREDISASVGSPASELSLRFDAFMHGVQEGLAEFSTNIEAGYNNFIESWDANATGDNTSAVDLQAEANHQMLNSDVEANASLETDLNSILP